jgi:hypothetical protein
MRSGYTEYDARVSYSIDIRQIGLRSRKCEYLVERREGVFSYILNDAV